MAEEVERVATARGDLFLFVFVWKLELGKAVCFIRLKGRETEISHLLLYSPHVHNR